MVARNLQITLKIVVHHKTTGAKQSVSSMREMNKRAGLTHLATWFAKQWLQLMLRGRCASLPITYQCHDFLHLFTRDADNASDGVKRHPNEPHVRGGGNTTYREALADQAQQLSCASWHKPLLQRAHQPPPQRNHQHIGAMWPHRNRPLYVNGIRNMLTSHSAQA